MRSHLLTGGCAFALVTAAGLGAQAQETEEPTQARNFDTIVVTATAKPQRIMDTSISTSVMSLDEINASSPRDTGEVLRSIPGVRSEASSGGGNLNLTVRGLPVSAGLKWVSLQEDGLPVLLFGDILTANVDQFIKLDETYSRIESVRGGSAATSTTNGSAAIINFISKTGEQEGGSASIRYGLDYDDFRTDLEYGGYLTDDLRFYIGGHWQEGGRLRGLDYNGTSGGQIRANVTKEFENGFVRVGYKRIDKSEATFMPQPSLVEGFTVKGDYPGLSANDETLHSPYIRLLPTVDGDGSLTTTDLADGVTTESDTFTATVQFDLDNGWRISNKTRSSSITGTFVAPFTWNINPDADAFYGDLGVDPSTVTIFNGPNAGEPADSAGLEALYGNASLVQLAVFNTEFEDLGNFVNEARLARTFEMGDSTLDVTVGHFLMNQNINTDWHMQNLLTTISNDAAQLSIPGQTTEGLFRHGLPFDWGGSNTYWNLEHSVSSPFVIVGYQVGNLSIEGSVRHETMKGEGGRNPGATGPVDLNGDDVIDPAEAAIPIPNRGVRQIQDYEFDDTAFSIGANYLINNDLAVFARYSEGHTFNADRPFDAGCVNYETGEGIEECIIDSTSFLEGGVKWQGDNFSLFATLFHSEATDNNGVFTDGAPRFIRQDYEAKGSELEGSLSLGNFNLVGSATWVDSEITDAESDPGVKNEALIGNTPKRQADLIYSLIPTYDFDAIDLIVGGSIVGTTDSYASAANEFTLEGFTTIGLFADYGLTDDLRLQLNVANLTDEVGITEAEGFTVDANGNGYAAARSITGRTTTLRLRYSF